MFSCNIIAHKCAYILIERQGKESCAKNRIRNIGRRNKVVLFFFPLPRSGGGGVKGFFVSLRLTIFCRFFLARARFLIYVSYVSSRARARVGLKALLVLGYSEFFRLFYWDIFPVYSDIFPVCGTFFRCYPQADICYPQGTFTFYIIGTLVFVVSITGNLSQYVKQEDFPSRIYQEQRQTIDRMSCQHEQYPCKGCTRLELKRETYHCDGPSQNRPSA